MKEPKVLFLDLETYGHDFAANMGFITCASYKWLHEKEVHTVTRLNPSKWTKIPENDKSICRQISEIISQADVVITWNGIQFDYKFLQARMLHWGLGSLKYSGHEDLLMTARKRLGMRPRSLEEVGRFLGCKESKQKVPKEIWLAVGRGDPKALKIWMRRCESDVKLLEEIYHKLGPLSITHPNMSGRSIEDGYCTFCTQKKLVKQGIKQALRHWRQNYQCRSCGKWQTGNPQKYTGAL